MQKSPCGAPGIPLESQRFAFVRLARFEASLGNGIPYWAHGMTSRGRGSEVLGNSYVPVRRGSPEDVRNLRVRGPETFDFCNPFSAGSRPGSMPTRFWSGPFFVPSRRSTRRLKRRYPPNESPVSPWPVSRRRWTAATVEPMAPAAHARAGRPAAFFRLGGWKERFVLMENQLLGMHRRSRGLVRNPG